MPNAKDHEKTIRTALERGLQITSKEPCGPSNDLMAAALSALTVMQEEISKLRGELEFAEGQRSELDDLLRLSNQRRREMQEERERIQAALKSLANEAYSFWAMASSATHGMTNMACLWRRIEEARAAIGEPAPPQQFNESEARSRKKGDRR